MVAMCEVCAEISASWVAWASIRAPCSVLAAEFSCRAAFS